MILDATSVRLNDSYTTVCQQSGQICVIWERATRGRGSHSGTWHAISMAFRRLDQLVAGARALVRAP